MLPAAPVRRRVRLHKPNEVLVSAVLRYVQWGLLAAAALGIAKGIFTQDPAGLGLLVLIPLAGGAAYLNGQLQKGAGEWFSMRLRSMALTHRCVEVVIVAGATVGAEPIQVQAKYSRTTRRGGGKHRHTEVLWRSPVTSTQPERFPDRTEFRVRIAMPDDFPEDLEKDEERWRRIWHLTVQVSGSRTFNFDFNVPRSGR